VNEAPIKGAADTELVEYWDQPFKTEHVDSWRWGCVEGKSNCSWWVVIGRSGETREDSDDVKSIEAVMSLSISSCESKIIERLLFVVVIVLVVVVVLLLLLILWSNSKYWDMFIVYEEWLFILFMQQFELEER
jgi:hypothetical protein